MYCEIVLQGKLKIEDIVLQYGHCIAEKEAWRVGFELQYTGVYCNRGSWVRLGICIAIQNLYCDCGARARPDRIAIQWPAKPRYSRGWAVGARAGACWARRQAQGHWAGRAWGVGWAWQAWRTTGRARGKRGARQAGRAARGRGRQAQADGRQRRARGVRSRGGAWALGARPGRVGWPWAVHLVHSAYFRSVLTRYCS